MTRKKIRSTDVHFVNIGHSFRGRDDLSRKRNSKIGTQIGCVSWLHEFRAAGSAVFLRQLKCYGEVVQKDKERDA